MNRLKPLIELAWVFLKIGSLSFGGPAAHIAMMEEEVVRRRGWIDQGRFLDLLGAVNLIPGPNSTEIALHVGRLRSGFVGLLVAGVATITPAFVCVLVVAHLYTAHGSRPEPAHILAGIRPVMAAIVVQALIRLAKSAWSRRSTIGLGLISLVAALAFEGRDLGIVAAAGVIAVAWERGVSPQAAGLLALGAPAVSGIVNAPTLPSLFWVFFKVGATLFGSGYVLLSYLRSDLVLRLGWLTETQLLDAIAVGQMTPGPLFTSATFVGYLLGGFSGAVVSTVGIFLPSFVLVALSGPLVPRLRASKTASAFLDGVNAASVALMAAVSIQVSRSFLGDPLESLIFLVAGVVLIRYRCNSAWLVAAGGMVGYLRGLI